MFDVDLFKSKESSTGLALGGGAMLGAAHIGVVRAIQELQLTVNMVSGTSIGALIGAMFAFGKSWEEILATLEDVKWMDVSSVSLNKSGIMSNKKLGKLLLDELGPANIEDSKIPLAIVASNIATGKKIVLREGSLARAVMASTCIPGVFTPVQFNDHLLVDGGVTENLPISPLLEMGAERVIGVDLHAKNKYEAPENIVEVLLNSFHFMLMHATKLRKENADVLIEPDLSGFSMIRTGKAKEIAEQGYEAAMSVLSKK